MKCPHCNKDFDFPRSMNVSHSQFGQWVHDNLPRIFDWIDIDGVVWKSQTRILRVIEEKRLDNDNLKSSQQRILPLLAMSIHYLVLKGIVNEYSGVFVIRTDYEEKFSISQMCGDSVRGSLLYQLNLRNISGTKREKALVLLDWVRQCFPAIETTEGIEELLYGDCVGDRELSKEEFIKFVSGEIL